MFGFRRQFGFKMSAPRNACVVATRSAARADSSSSEQPYPYDHVELVACCVCRKYSQIDVLSCCDICDEFACPITCFRWATRQFYVVRGVCMGCLDTDDFEDSCDAELPSALCYDVNRHIVVRASLFTHRCSPSRWAQAPAGTTTDCAPPTALLQSVPPLRRQCASTAPLQSVPPAWLC